MDKKKIIIIASIIIAVIVVGLIVIKLSMPKTVSKDLAKIPSTFIARVVYSQTSGPDMSSAKNFYICKDGENYICTSFTYKTTIKGVEDEVEIKEMKIKKKNDVNKIFKEISKAVEVLGGHSSVTIYLKDGSTLENKEALAEYLFK